MAIVPGSYTLDECAGTIIQSSNEYLTFCGSYINFYDSFITIDSDGYIQSIVIKLINVLTSGQYCGDDLVFDITLPFMIGENSSDIKGIALSCDFTICDGSNTNILDLINNDWFSEGNGRGYAYLQFPQNYTSCGYLDSLDNYLYTIDNTMREKTEELFISHRTETSDGKFYYGPYGVHHFSNSSNNTNYYEVRFSYIGNGRFNTVWCNGQMDRNVNSSSSSLISFSSLDQELLPSIPTGNTFYGWSTGSPYNTDNIISTDRIHLQNMLVSKFSKTSYTYLWHNTKCTVNLGFVGTVSTPIFGFQEANYTIYNEPLTLSKIYSEVSYYYLCLEDFFEFYHSLDSDGNTIVFTPLSNTSYTYNNSDSDSIILTDGDYLVPWWEEITLLFTCQNDNDLSNSNIAIYLSNYINTNKKSDISVFDINTFQITLSDIQFNINNQYTTDYELYKTTCNVGNINEDGIYELSIDSLITYIENNNIHMSSIPYQMHIADIYYKLVALLTQKVKVAGIWRNISKIYTKVHGSWQTVTLKIKQEGEWKS